MDMHSDFDRLLFFEHARKTAESSYAKNPNDAEVSISISLSYFGSLTLSIDY